MTDTVKLTLRQKLVQVYGKIDHVEKSGTNEKQKYKFVRSADVLRTVRKALLELGIYAQTNFELLGAYDIATNSGGKMHTATVRATIMLHDTDTDEIITVSGLGDGADSGDKGIYKAQTGAVKNALRNAFLVPDEEDPEADEKVDNATIPVIEQQRKIPGSGSVPNISQRPGVGSRPTQVPKAEIPSYEKTRNSHPSEPDYEIPQNGQKPTAEELVKIRAKFGALAEELKTAGLKETRNKPAAIKLKEYLLKTTGVSEPSLITLVQWNTFFSLVDKVKEDTYGVEKLVQIISGEKEATA